LLIKQIKLSYQHEKLNLNEILHFKCIYIRIDVYKNN
jgi:hypothetical protein